MRTRTLLPLLIVTLVAGAIVGRAVAQEDAALPRIAVLARDEVPFDSLAAGAIAGHVGGVVCITSPTNLSPEAAACVREFAPDVVIVAGGFSAISQAVADAAASECDCVIDRRGGAGRDETAYLLSQAPTDYGYGRPLLTGEHAIVGDAALRGQLRASGLLVDGDGRVGGTLRVGDLVTDSRAVVERLNADELDGKDASQFVLRERTTQHITCPHDGFLPLETAGGREWAYYQDVPVGSETNWYRTAVGSDNTFTCVIHLPDGASIRELDVYVDDFDPDDDAGPCWIQRTTLDPQSGDVKFGETSATSGEGGPQILHADVTASAVDTQTMAHSIWCELDTGSSIGISSARVTYVVTNG